MLHARTCASCCVWECVDKYVWMSADECMHVVCEGVHVTVCAGE